MDDINDNNNNQILKDYDETETIVNPIINNKNNKNKIYIFDLDDTLYQKDEKGFVCNYIIPDILRSLKGIKILFSNGTFNYCNSYLMRMGVKDCFTAIFSSDILHYYKPHLSTYKIIMSACGFSTLNYDIIFFDNLYCNLIPAFEIYGWITVLILPYYNNDKYQPLNNVSIAFNNINDAVKHFID